MSGVRMIAAPRCVVEGARRDVLRQRVDRGGDRVRWVGLIGPVATEDVEGPTTEQERAGVAVQLRDELADRRVGERRSEEHTSELQSLMRNSYAVFCL